MSARVRIVDFETSDMDGEVIEVGVCDVFTDGEGWQVGEPASWLCGIEGKISPTARAVHHISDDMIAGLPKFDPGAMWERARADGVRVVSAHNLSFEAKYWGDPGLPLLCSLKAARQAWPDAPGHSNGVLRYWLDETGQITPDHEKTMPPHRAGPDTYVSAWIVKALLSVTTANQCVAWTKLPLLQPRIMFGKHKGEWKDAPGDYLDWIVRKSDMDADTKWNAKREIDRRAA